MGEGSSPHSWQPRTTTMFGFSGRAKHVLAMLNERKPANANPKIRKANTKKVTAFPALVSLKPFILFQKTVIRRRKVITAGPAILPELKTGNVHRNDSIPMLSITIRIVLKTLCLPEFAKIRSP
jgi:hypothetical protein